MATVLPVLARSYHVLNEDWTDERTKDYWLIASPIPIITIIASYIYFVRVLGPRLMADRKPFELDWLIRIFDLIQIIANLYIFERSFSLAWSGRYSWRCEPIDQSRSPHALEIINGVYTYFLIKIGDLIDTVFFVLRKKQSHVTFLHVYHHGGMILAAWLGVKFFPGGHGIFLGFINSFVHAVMYTYYLLTSLNPEYKKYIWWKKYITQMQMFQFFLIIIHSGQLFVWNSCKYPLLPIALLLPQNLFMLILFYDFYRKTYMSPKNE